MGKIKNTISNFQREVTSATNDLDVEKDINKVKDDNLKDKNDV